MSEQLDLSALKGKSAMILGAATGIGLAIATRFARAGVHVILADVQVEVGSHVASDLREEGHNVTFMQCNVTEYDSIVRVFQQAIASLPSGSLDIVALVAGVMGTRGSLLDQILESRHHAEENGSLTPARPRHSAIDVNLVGIYEATYVALYYMSSRRVGEESVGAKKSLILISSSAAYTDAAQFPDYQVSKFGVRGLFRSLRHSTLAFNIRLNALAPHFVQTGLVKEALPVFKSAGVTPGSGMTFVDVERVVDAAVQLAIDENLHGRTLAIFQEPLGIVDIVDEEEGLWGGIAMKKLVDGVRQAGDIIR